MVSARARHVEALAARRVHIWLAARASSSIGRRHPELVAEELRRAQQALGEIVGAEGSEELLGRIFAVVLYRQISPGWGCDGYARWSGRHSGPARPLDY